MIRELTYAVLIPIHEPSDYLDEALSSVIDDIDDITPIYLILHKPNSQLRHFISSNRFFERVTLLESHAETLGGCLNDGLTKIKEDFVFRMDSDDIWRRGRFVIQKNYLKKFPNAAVIGGGITVGNSDLAISHTLKVRKVTKLSVWNFLKDCPIKHPTVVYNREKILSIGGYKPTLRATEDYDLWIRVAAEFQIILVPEVLLTYRLHAGSQSLNFGNEQRAETALIRETAACRMLRISECHSMHGLKATKSCRTRIMIIHFLNIALARPVIVVEGV